MKCLPAQPHRVLAVSVGLLRRTLLLMLGGLFVAGNAWGASGLTGVATQVTAPVSQPATQAAAPVAKAASPVPQPVAQAAAPAAKQVAQATQAAAPVAKAAPPVAPVAKAAAPVAKAAAPVVAEILAGELGWSRDQKVHAIEDYISKIERQKQALKSHDT